MRYSDVLPPISRVPGHLPSCFDSCGNYRSCVDLKCPASIAWGSPDVRGRAYADYDIDMKAAAKTAEEEAAQRQGPGK